MLRFLHYIYSMKHTMLLAIFAACSVIELHAQSLSKTLTFGDTTRTYRIYIPAIYDSSQPVPLVMALHGLGDNANNFQGVGFNQIANTQNFIAVYPNALTDPLLGASGWSAGVNPLNNIDDVGFLNALLDTIQREYSVDTNRIFVCGFSLGGFMTHRLACESGERIAAIASVAGTMPAPLVSACVPNAMPVLHIHGTSDQTIPYDFGVIFFVVTNLGADSTAHYWATHNGCNASFTSDSFPNTKNDGLTFEKFSYSGCSDSSEVILIKANGMPHTWPYTPANDIDATEEIWDFFSRHQKVIPSDTTNTFIQEMNLRFSFLPNPASEFVQITSDLNGKMELTLRDITGKQLYQNTIPSDSYFLSLNNYQSGVYFLTLSTGETRITKKLIISR